MRYSPRLNRLYAMSPYTMLRACLRTSPPASWLSSSCEFDMECEVVESKNKNSRLVSVAKVEKRKCANCLADALHARQAPGLSSSSGGGLIDRSSRSKAVIDSLLCSCMYLVCMCVLRDIRGASARKANWNLRPGSFICPRICDIRNTDRRSEASGPLAIAALK
ncbi:hypothetical protein DL89DRAFT_79250 [Linderina pennispora]|uniref:Uncharacterized protein n=1 Tax=Linderina pennispora TaxID=61395 RepID=A0A1Y1VQR0_9FUNG|nr:uncharacterized protein DL89DRAFT_79250 [Linderina pennispora]ORX63503.1 hypothetical protein DL89DRAFT_79250 [Linderina pennispora]